MSKLRFIIITIALVGFVSLFILFVPRSAGPANSSEPSPNVLYQATTSDNGQTLKEVLLPDGTRCVIVSYSTALQTVCNWK